MLKKNKGKIILSSILILLPMLFGMIFWKDLPDAMTTHWGADGVADGVGSKAFVVFGLPGMLLVLHLVCLVLTMLDKKQKEQSPKALNMIFWIVPIISLLTNGILYRAAFGRGIDIPVLLPLLMGAMFLLIGNYLPKVKRNSTLGIKITWTLRNEENWARTHRFGGKVWVVCGFVTLVTLFLPLEVMLWVFLGVLAVAVLLPVAYSYGIYRKHQKAGVVYAALPQSKAAKIVTGILLPLVLVGVGVLMFTGDVRAECRQTALEITATYWTDLTVEYDRIDTVAYCKDLDVGARTNGYQSARLSLGIFQNEEFGPYTLYGYAGAKEYVVLTSGEKTLVIGLKDPVDTRALYDTLLNKLGQ